MTNTATANVTDETITLLNEALSLQQGEQLKEAEKLYKKALTNSRHQIDVATMVAVFYQQIGRHKYVVTLLNKALRQNPHHVKAQSLLGKSLLADENYEAALKCLSSAELLSPDTTEITYNKALCLHRMTRLDDAIAAYKKVHQNIAELSYLDQLNFYHNLSDLHLSQHNRDEAIRYLEEAVAHNLATYDTLTRLAISYGESTEQGLKYIMQALSLDIDCDIAKALFARACEMGQMPPLGNENIKNILTACLSSKSVNQQSIALPWILNFFLITDKELAEDLFDIDQYQAFIDRINEFKGIDIFLDPYFLTGLSRIRPNRVNIERIFTYLRRYCLETYRDHGQLRDEETPLIAALAQQSFENEYIFTETDHERSYLEELTVQLQSKSSLSEADEQALLLYATYRPLLSLSAANELQTIPFGAEMKEVIALTISNPQQEQMLKKSIRALSLVENETSKAVKQQYEENPYPRWRTESIFKPYHTDAIAKQYQKKNKVLIAGCGTGKHILTAFHVYPNAKFTAIDISLASLSYAKRKLIEYELDKDVSLYQCDLLEVNKLKDEFDYIECCGVLHHIKEPPKGLKALVSKLRPGGRIKLALYSSTARQAILETRQFIEEQGYKPTRKDILDCRNYLTNEYISGNKRFPIHKWRDFYTLSECRDLLFHIQEHNYDLNEVEQLLDGANLRFDRFSIDTKTKAAYDEMFNAKGEKETLEDWGKFEQKHPETFAGMYQFQAYKKA
ncbi:MAG: hypothetical protein DHS20C08_22150 [Rhodomicrobium sp.]|nr:MAG: hypothetical protein DHS20C08_22150 [Rhodomicrobium sp.]